MGWTIAAWKEFIDFLQGAGGDRFHIGVKHLARVPQIRTSGGCLSKSSVTEYSAQLVTNPRVGNS